MLKVTVDLASGPEAGLYQRGFLKVKLTWVLGEVQTDGRVFRVWIASAVEYLGHGQTRRNKLLAALGSN